MKAVDLWNILIYFCAIFGFDYNFFTFGFFAFLVVLASGEGSFEIFRRFLSWLESAS
jgi:hypothetical protein